MNQVYKEGNGMYGYCYIDGDGVRFYVHVKGNAIGPFYSLSDAMREFNKWAN